MTAIPLTVRVGVYKRAGYRCERCGRHPASSYSVHHRLPRQAGGDRTAESNSYANLVLLCGSGVTGCHGFVESNRTRAYAEGWLIHRGVLDPAHVPLELWDGRVVLLDPFRPLYIASPAGTDPRAASAGLNVGGSVTQGEGVADPLAASEGFASTNSGALGVGAPGPDVLALPTRSRGVA